MLMSMTGFSSTNLLIEQGDQKIYLTLNLKTLNSRFIEINCKLPYILSSLETEFIKIFKENLLRGSVYFTINMHNQNALIAAIEPSLNIASNYINAVEKIKSNFNLSGNLTVSEIINLPNIFEVKEGHIEPKTITLIINAVKNLVHELVTSRINEGKATEVDLKNRIHAISKNITEIEQLSKNLTATKKEQLLKTLQELIANKEVLELQSINISRELERIDINEEVVRAKSHLVNFETTLTASGNEKGKKLDFILQELFREVNTIASKASDAKISSLVINVKVELEKAREQVQNIV